MFGGVEGGGTKFVCVIGRDPSTILETQRIEVTTPEATIAAALAFFRRAQGAGIALDAIGIGSFGPVELRPTHPRYGWITTTPKPGWSATDIRGPFAREFSLPVGFDLDVNAAALAEGRWGAAAGCSSWLYLTMGTGIGGGAVVGGRLLFGLGHPEMGHIAVPRRPGDDFGGSCPFHGDCFEGMASGPALAARFGRRAETLGGAELAKAAALAGYYLGVGVRSLAYTLAPERVVVGGGLAGLPGMLEAARAVLAEQMDGYATQPEHGAGFLVGAGLGAMAGPAGTLILAEQAAGSRG